MVGQVLDLVVVLQALGLGRGGELYARCQLHVAVDGAALEQGAQD